MKEKHIETFKTDKYLHSIQWNWNYGNGDMELKMEITKKYCFDNCPTTENRKPGCQVKRRGNEAI